MKFLLLVFSFFAFNLVQAQEISLETKKIIFDGITEDIFFEDEGFVRMPQKIADFNFTYVDEFMLKISGSSYSHWDDKELIYYCVVEVLTRNLIQSSRDIRVSCQVEGENWPYIN